MIPSRIILLSLLTGLASPASGTDKIAFHYDRERSGWNATEMTLTPRSVAGGSFGLIWQSPQLDGFGDVPPRLFASPLYLHSVSMSDGSFAGRSFAVAFAVTTTGYAYAINASAGRSPSPGTILWRTRLTDKPCEDGASGNLSTPVIDVKAGRLYATSCDAEKKWSVHALDYHSGRELPHWPLSLDAPTFNQPGLNKNSGNMFSATRTIIQRGALNLSADGARLYIAIGPDSAGWLATVDTQRAQVVSAFSSTARTEEDQGGMWASGGASIDDQGLVYIATGAKFLARARNGVAGIYPDSAHDWGQSVLQFRDDRKGGLELLATYSPFNYCQAAAADIDLGSSGTVVIDIFATLTATPHLLTVGGKQGNLYLLDRDHLPGGIEKRHPCSTDPDTDGSLLNPNVQPQFGLRGPLNLFGPYSDYVSMLDQAKSRSTPAYYRDAQGRFFVYATGSAKTGVDFATSIPPGLARVAIVTDPGQRAFLKIANLEGTQTFENPGSPVVSSNGSHGAVVWVFDTNAPRTASLYGAGAPKPVLYAFDATTLKLLWKSKPGQIFPSGKYNEPAVVDGMALIGSDRIQAFGLQAAAKSRSADGHASPKQMLNPASRTAGVSSSAKNSPPAATDIAAGRFTFKARCASCHESGQPGTPTRADLARLSKAKIVETLLHGVMRPMATNLSQQDAHNIAGFLTSGR